MNYETSADYIHIDDALKALWHPFNDLVDEMDKFVPRPLSEYETQRREMFQEYKRLNPASSDESLAELVDEQITFSASEKIQFSDAFSKRFMTIYISVAFLSHALCEAGINAVLAIGLAEHGSAELFALLEKANIKEKWRVGPKSFDPTYELKGGTALSETLAYLTQRRNALVHYKVKLHVDGTKILDGSTFERTSFQESIQWTRRFFSLPYDLMRHACTQMRGSSSWGILHDTSPIVTADEHKASPS